MYVLHNYPRPGAEDSWCGTPKDLGSKTGARGTAAWVNSERLLKRLPPNELWAASPAGLKIANGSIGNTPEDQVRENELRNDVGRGSEARAGGATCVSSTDPTVILRHEWTFLVLDEREPTLAPGGDASGGGQARVPQPVGSNMRRHPSWTRKMQDDGSIIRAHGNVARSDAKQGTTMHLLDQIPFQSVTAMITTMP
jgi:hypothetical protein